MRYLTEAEGRILGVLLGAGPTSERDRLHRAEVPRSTYHAARRRAYAEGWVQDRYVPDPVRIGYPWATVLLLRPFADRAEATRAAWTEDPTNILTWWGPQSALGVFLHATPEDAEEFARRLESQRPGSVLSAIRVHLTEAELPVFFDYEGLWVHLAGLAGTTAYPNGLGGQFPGADGAPAPTTDHQRWAIAELVHRPFVAAASGKAGHLVGPFGLPFSQLRLLRDGWVTHRVFLYPSRLPPYQGRSADQIVFLAGRLRAGARPEEMFAVLTRECRVYPFLFAVHEGQALIGALGRAPGTGPDGVAPSPASDPVRRPVLPTLQAYMEGIDITQEHASQLRPVVDFRFDRLVPRRT